MNLLWTYLLCASVAGPTDFHVRVSTGLEYDSNATRTAVDDKGASDALIRTLANLKLSTSLDRHRIIGDFTVGAKTFAKKLQEDLIVEDFRLRTLHGFGKNWSFSLRGLGRARQTRNGLRDYYLASGQAYIQYSHILTKENTSGSGTDLTNSKIKTALIYSLSSSLSNLHYPPNDQFDYVQPALLSGVTLDRKPYRLSLNLSYSWRDYAGEASTLRSEDDSTPVPCERQRNVSCTVGARSDRELSFGGSFSYTGKFLWTLSYLFVQQDSNLSLAEVTRHKFATKLTIPIFDKLSLSVMGTLQNNNAEVVADTVNIITEDGIQNSVQAQIRYLLSEHFSLEARYGLYSNLVESASPFVRQTIYFGIVLRNSEQKP